MGCVCCDNRVCRTPRIFCHAAATFHKGEQLPEGKVGKDVPVDQNMDSRISVEPRVATHAPPSHAMNNPTCHPCPGKRGHIKPQPRPFLA